jgi:hypothetical protein
MQGNDIKMETKVLFLALSELTALKKIYLQGNSLHGSLPEFAKLTKLEVLDIR